MGKFELLPEQFVVLTMADQFDIVPNYLFCVFIRKQNTFEWFRTHSVVQASSYLCGILSYSQLYRTLHVRGGGEVEKSNVRTL